MAMTTTVAAERGIPAADHAGSPAADQTGEVR
jgi:hypothetical protein